ncbi:Lrp/AsnC family transcriptional regulator [Flavitalea sp.]|nr:Lrp/AsnC family transcriptional regulator [Flavitalea sp.]
MEINLDSVDLQILNIMQTNAKIANVELARQLEMAPSAVLERVKKLEQKEVIKGYTTRIDPLAVQQKLLAFIFIKATDGMGTTETARCIAAIPEVQEVHHIAGEDCFLIKIRTADSASLMNIMRTRLSSIPRIVSTRTTIVLETVKEENTIIISKAPSL